MKCEKDHGQPSLAPGRSRLSAEASMSESGLSRRFDRPPVISDQPNFGHE
jgi:hypothetical protein